MVECSFFITNCWYTFSNASGIEKPHNFGTKIFYFDQFNLKNHCCNVSLNIMMKRLKYKLVNILICCAFFFFFFFFFFKFESSGKNYLEAFNLSVLVDCSNKENSENVIKEIISCQYVKKNILVI